jgi:RNA polymerase sigma-70 factor (ECF subfamily)
MACDGDASDPTLEAFRNYLELLARVRMDPRLRGKLDPADLVQQTLLRAVAAQERFRGDDARRAAWLRTILARVMIDAVRKLGRPGGGERERSLEAALEHSSARLEAFLAADLTSPSGRAERNERLLRLADALARLPEDQRRAVELRHLQGLPLAEIAAQMGRSADAVVGLIHRGLRALRRDLEELREEMGGRP